MESTSDGRVNWYIQLKLPIQWHFFSCFLSLGLIFDPFKLFFYSSYNNNLTRELRASNQRLRYFSIVIYIEINFQIDVNAFLNQWQCFVVCLLVALFDTFTYIPCSWQQRKCYWVSSLPKRRSSSKNQFLWPLTA